MKLDFDLETTFTPEWNGNKDLPAADQFTVTVSDMSVADMLIVVDAMASIQDVQADIDTGKVPADQMKAVLTAASEIMPRYCTVHNLNRRDGSPVTVEEVAGHSRYLGLLMEIFGAMVNTSNVSEDDAGNSPTPSD